MIIRGHPRKHGLNSSLDHIKEHLDMEYHTIKNLTDISIVVPASPDSTLNIKDYVHHLLVVKGYVFTFHNTSPGYVQKIDPEAMSIVDEVSFYQYLASATYARRKIYVPCGYSPPKKPLRIVELDPETLEYRVVCEIDIPTGTNPAITTDGKYLYVAPFKTSAPQQVYKISLDDFSIVASTAISGYYQCQWIQYDPKTKRVFLIARNYGQQKAAVIRLTTDLELEEAFTVPDYSRSWFSDDNAVIDGKFFGAFETDETGDAKGKILVADAMNLSDYRIIDVGVTEYSWGTFTDGRWVIATFKDGTVVIMDPETEQWYKVNIGYTKLNEFANYEGTWFFTVYEAPSKLIRCPKKKIIFSAEFKSCIPIIKTPDKFVHVFFTPALEDLDMGEYKIYNVSELQADRIVTDQIYKGTYWYYFTASDSYIYFQIDSKYSLGNVSLYLDAFSTDKANAGIAGHRIENLCFETDYSTGKISLRIAGSDKLVVTGNDIDAYVNIDMNSNGIANANFVSFVSDTADPASTLYPKFWFYGTAEPYIPMIALGSADTRHIVVTPALEDLDMNGYNIVNAGTISATYMEMGGFTVARTFGTVTTIGTVSPYEVTITHNLNDLAPLVVVYDDDTGEMIEPQSVTVVDANTIKLTFGSEDAGKTIRVKVMA